MMFPSRSGSSDAPRSKKRSAMRALTAAASTLSMSLLLLMFLFFSMAMMSTEASKASKRSPTSTKKVSSAAASVSLHATWEAAPLVLEALEFLVRLFVSWR